MKQPLISVVMSVHNEEKYLKDSIKSILNQTFDNIEFIIIDDGSTDTTQKILEHYAKKDERIKLIVNKKNIGLSRSLNKGIEIAKGKYIARMDAGDISHPKRFEKQTELLEENENVYILGTWAYWMDENKEIIGEWKKPSIISNDRLLFKAGAAIHPSIMIKKKLFEGIGLYDIGYDISLEFELYMRAMKNGFDIANIPEFLIYVMRRYGGMSFSQLKTTQLHQFKIKLKYLPYFFNFWNIIYTTRSLVGYLLPSFLLKKFVESSIKSI